MNYIKDSSIWRNNYTDALVNRKDARVKVGIVRSVLYNDKILDDIKYIVEVHDDSVTIPITCIAMQKFGGPFNYEEFIYRGYVPAKGEANQGPYNTKAGDVVLVAYINGHPREGVILGSLKHTARKRKLSKADDVAYLSEFNGVHTSINKDGEYRLTFKGQPTNLSALNVPPNGTKIQAPTYNTSTGSSYFEFDKTGSFKVTDNSSGLIQYIKIDKSAGLIDISAGNVKFKLEKNSEKASLIAKLYDVSATDSIKETTKDFSVDASSTVKIKAPKVAIGSGGVELLDKLISLIDGLGALTVISPVGMCAPLMATPQWAQVEAVKSAINSIKGSL